MLIGELFCHDITRRIEEVVKVDLGDEAVVVDELDEYVATRHILAGFERVLDAYQESILAPNQSTNVWVSGFFGSGKSAWAKTLGYLLENPTIAGRSAAQRFFERANAPVLESLCNTIYAQAPTLAVFLNLATGADAVSREGESVVLPVYRSLLKRLDYSSNLMLAELEWDLEGDGRLEEFERCFAEVLGASWRQRRYTSLAISEASRALHDMDPATFPQADSWSVSAAMPVVNAGFVANRAAAALERRGKGAKRVVFVVDEAGQYVSRSVERMLGLQGLAEACQVRRGQVWLVATSQESLKDVVDSLESRRIELARVRDRFPIEVDLLPSDIEEVTSRRVLDKTSEGQRATREALRSHRQQLGANTALSSVARSAEASEDELVKLYPLVPYQVQLLIDAVSARRAQGGASPTVGGSNRTLIKHAQALLVHPDHGLASKVLGALVTIDRSYDLLEEMIPTTWRAEVDQVARQYGPDSAELAVIKVIALCADVRALPLNPQNLAAMLHPSIGAESRRPEVVAALAHLVADDRIRQAGDGYALQSPEQKDWERDRRGVDLSPGQAVRLRRELLGETLAAISISRGRSFSVGLVVEGEKLSDGQLSIEVVEAAVAAREALRSESRESANANRIGWAHELADPTWQALRELHRSKAIIERRDRPNKTAAEVELLGQERRRLEQAKADSLAALSDDLCAGVCIFRGQIEELTASAGRDLRSVAQAIIASHLEDIYFARADFDANVKSADALTLLHSERLDGLPDSLGAAGIGLLRMTPAGPEIVEDAGPLQALLVEVRARAAYGQEATGGHLERHFGAPPYGARVEVVEAVCAAGLRSGALEVVHQGQRLVNRSDQRTNQVFNTLPHFRAAAFRPPSESDVPITVRAELAERLDHLVDGQRSSGLGTDSLAAALRESFSPLRQACGRVSAALAGAGLVLPDVVRSSVALAERLAGPDDAEVVLSAHNTWVDLIAGREAVGLLDELCRTRIGVIRAAAEEARRSDSGLPAEAAAEHAELVELLARADLVGDASRIVALGDRLVGARSALAVAAAQRLVDFVEAGLSECRAASVGIEMAVLAEVLRPLETLRPPLDTVGLDAEILESRMGRAAAALGAARRQLAELAEAGRLAWVRVGELAPEVVHDEAELEATLERIRGAAMDELSAGKTIRLC